MPRLSVTWRSKFIHVQRSMSIDMDSSTAADNGSISNGGDREPIKEREESVSSPVPAIVHDASAEKISDQATTELTDSASINSPTLAVDKNATNPQVSEHRKGVLDVATEYINANIKAFRRLPWIIGGVGVVLLIRFYPRMAFRRYRRPSDIPRQLFENNARLTGVVAMTGWDSVGVWHVPLWRRVLRWRHQPTGTYSEDELLNVKFAGVAIGSPEGSEKWLESTLLGRKVWFTLLDHTPNRKSLTSVVYAKRKGFGRKWCVNEQLLAEGLGALDEVTGFKNAKDYTNFIHRLGTRETTAKRTGAGMWKGSEYVSWWRRLAKMLRLSS